MAHLLWPQTSPEELEQEFMAMEENTCANFLYKSGNDYAGFITVSLRHDYVEESETSPVAYIEGLYVEDGFRRKGIAARLVKAAEAWGKEKGCSEIGSDCEIDNQASIDFHTASGFEAKPIVCFIKKIG